MLNPGKERLAKLSVEDRANFQSWLLEQKAGHPAARREFPKIGDPKIIVPILVGSLL